MVQRDFNQNYHCTQLNLLYSTSNTIKIKLIFSKTKFDHNSYTPRMTSLLSLCSHLVDFIPKQLKILSSIDNC